MLSPCPTLHPKLERTLAAFRAAGVQPSDAEIAWLAGLREPCDNPSDGSVPWVMGAPLHYAGVDWYPMHRLADVWFVRAFKLLEGNDHEQILAYLFAHAHSAPGDTSVRPLMLRSDIRRRLHPWFDTLPLHEGQLNPLIKRLRDMDGDTTAVPEIKEDDAEEQTLPVDELPRFAAVMCKEFPGVSPEFWLTEIAARDARMMLDGANEGGFAESSLRRTAVANYLKAVKWVWWNHQSPATDEETVTGEPSDGQ